MAGIGETIAKIKQFLREVRAELKRVAWPGRKETIGSTSIVLVLVILVAAFLGFVDFGLRNLVRQVLS